MKPGPLKMSNLKVNQTFALNAQKTIQIWLQRRMNKVPILKILNSLKYLRLYLRRLHLIDQRLSQWEVLHDSLPPVSPEDI